MNCICHSLRVIHMSIMCKVSSQEYYNNLTKIEKKNIAMVPKNICKPINMNSEVASSFLPQYQWALIKNLLVIEQICWLGIATLIQTFKKGDQPVME